MYSQIWPLFLPPPSHKQLKLAKIYNLGERRAARSVGQMQNYSHVKSHLVKMFGQEDQEISF